jgi:hypothetical protein
MIDWKQWCSTPREDWVATKMTELKIENAKLRNRITELEARIAELDRWIPVGERLPEKESTAPWETYLCKIDWYGTVHTAPLYYIGSWQSQYSGGFNYDKFVTHWKYLEPPEEE